MMHFSCLRWTCCLFFFAAMAIGCGPADQKKTKAKTSDAARKAADQPPRIVRIDVEPLPELDDPFPVPETMGPIEVAKPKGWYRKDSTDNEGKKIMYWRPSLQDLFPRIILSVENYEGLEAVTPENVVEFATAVRSQLRLNDKKTSKDGDVVAVLIGDFAGASYRRRTKTKDGQIYLRMYLVTVSQNRKYTLELLGLPGSFEVYIPYARSMARGIVFSPDKQPSPPEFGGVKKGEK